MQYDDDDDRAYDVGYGRPPKWTQFQKGQSGNPRGRPPMKRIKRLLEMSATDKAARAELERVLQFKEGGKTKKMPARNILLKTLMKEAFGGNTHALKLALGLSEGIDKRDAQRALLEEQLKQERIKNLRRLRDVRERIWKDAQRNGTEPDQPWPHPEDILLDDATQECRIRGPLVEEDVPRFEYMRCERDAAFGKAMLYWLDSDDASEAIFKLFMMAVIIWDRELPLRWQYMPRYDETVNRLCLHMRGLRKWTKERQAELQRLKPLYCDPKIEKAAAAQADRILNKAVRSLGFKSRQQFEEQLQAN